MKPALLAGRAAPAALLLFVAVLLAYSNSFEASFHFDDQHQIVKNHHIRSMRNIPRFFVDADMGTYLPALKGYRPVTYSSFALNYALSGYDVWSYHAFNLLMHFLCALLVFLIARSVFEEAGVGDGHIKALVTALIFAAHPVQTNAVTYISGRAALLAGFFSMLAFWAFLQYRAGGGQKRLWAAALPLFFALGLLSKETAVGLLAILAAYDLVFTLPGKRTPAGPKRRLMRSYAPLIAVLLLYLAARKALQGYAAVKELEYGIREYLMVEAKVLLMYVRLLVLPMNQNAYYHIPVTGAVDVLLVFSLALVAIALFLLYRLRRGSPAAAFFGLWFFLALAPESSLVPIPDVAVEYRLYLPSVGFIASAVLLAAGVLKTQALKRGLAALALAVFVVLTINRNAVWANELSLWKDVARKSPDSFTAHLNLSSALFADKQYFESVNELQRAAAVDPGNPEVYKVNNSMGVCFIMMDMVDEAIDQFKAAVKSRPDFIEAYENLGKAYFRKGRYDDAAALLYRAVEINPGYSPVRSMLAGALMELGRGNDALAQMKEALRYSPKDFEANFNMAIVYRQNGMLDEAIRQAGVSLTFASDETERKDAEALLSELQVKGRAAIRRER